MCSPDGRTAYRIYIYLLARVFSQSEVALHKVRARLGILQGMLDGRLELLAVNLIDKVDQLQALRARLQRLLVADDVAVVWACIGGIDVQIDCDQEVSVVIHVFKPVEELTGS